VSCIIPHAPAKSVNELAALKPHQLVLLLLLLLPSAVLLTPVMSVNF
jgi:hypothetical protein